MRRFELGVIVAAASLSCTRGTVPMSAEPPPPPLSEPIGVDPEHGDAAGEAQTPSSGPDHALTPEDWAWALAFLPSLSEHAPTDPAHDAFAEFHRWAPVGESLEVWLRLGDRCTSAQGDMHEDGFFGRHRVATDESDRDRRIEFFGLEITGAGVVETGPHHERWQRGADETWKLVGGGGTGWVNPVARGKIVRTVDDAVWFGGHGYTLAPYCVTPTLTEQGCSDGSVRTCESCPQIGLQQQPLKTTIKFVVRGEAVVKLRAPGRIDCSEPCPDENAMAHLERLERILKDRPFFGQVDPEPVVYRVEARCRADLRRAPPKGSSAKR